MCSRDSSTIPQLHRPICGWRKNWGLGHGLFTTPACDRLSFRALCRAGSISWLLPTGRGLRSSVLCVPEENWISSDPSSVYPDECPTGQTDIIEDGCPWACSRCQYGMGRYIQQDLVECSDWRTTVTFHSLFPGELRQPTNLRAEMHGVW